MICPLRSTPGIEKSNLWGKIQEHEDWVYFWTGILKNGKQGVAFRSETGNCIISFETA